MTNEDAAKVLGLTGNLTKEIIKKAYRVASNKYHPDKGGSVEMMQAVNQAYKVLRDFEGSIDNDQINYGEELNDAINKIIHLQGVEIEVCGSWVWVTGNTKPHAKLLGRKEGGAGFYYASKKKAWYYRPEGWKSYNRGTFSLEEIRKKHGSNSIKTRPAEQLRSA